MTKKKPEPGLFTIFVHVLFGAVLLLSVYVIYLAMSVFGGWTLRNCAIALGIELYLAYCGWTGLRKLEVDIDAEKTPDWYRSNTKDMLFGLASIAASLGYFYFFCIRKVIYSPEFAEDKSMLDAWTVISVVSGVLAGAIAATFFAKSKQHSSDLIRHRDQT